MRGMFLALALGAVPLTSAASAATLTFSGSGTGSFNLGKFDAALGTLQSATFDYYGSATEADSAFSAGPGDTATASASASIKIVFAGLTFEDSGVDTQTCTSNVGECSVDAIADAIIVGSVSNPLLDLALLTGSGFALVEVFGSPSAGADASITYTYNPVAAVPLPAGGGLLIAGLGGLAALRRRRAV